MNTNESARPALRVLVVDDQPKMCWLFAHILEDAGFEVATEETSSQALELFARDRHDVVLIDYRLPDGDGLTLFGKLRQLDAGCRAILMTSYGSDDLRERARRAGIAACVDKPFSNDKLIALLHEVGALAAHGVDSRDLGTVSRESVPDEMSSAAITLKQDS